MHDPTRPADPQGVRPEEPDADPAPTQGQDWESRALSRVARHVDSLAPAADTSTTGQLRAFGWEAVALARLRRHLRRPEEG